MKATWVQTNFNAGEWTPLAWGRFDLAKYKNGLAECKNFTPTQQGGLTRRPGTRAVSAVKDSSYAPRLQRFEFSITQAYVLEFGNNYIRFFANDGQLLNAAHTEWSGTGATAWYTATTYAAGDVRAYGGLVYLCLLPHTSGAFATDLASGNWLRTYLHNLGDLVTVTVGAVKTNYRCITAHDGSGVFATDYASGYWNTLGVVGTPVEVATTYTSSQIWSLDFEQSADTLYIAAANHAPAKLQRFGTDAWGLTTLSPLDGPYLSVNITTTTMTPSGTSGTVTVTASDVAGINNGVGFRASDIGRVLRLKCGGVWLWGVVSQVTGPTTCKWAINSGNGAQIGEAATATANVSGGSVFTVSISNGGSGYGASPPSVSFLPTPTVRGTGHVTVVGGVVTAIAIDTAGSGYAGGTGDVTVVLSQTGGGTGATFHATYNAGVLSTAVVLTGGSGYSSGTKVAFLGGGAGGGSGAVAYASVANGVVTSIIVSVTGTGYTGGADVALTAPALLVPATTLFWRLGLWNSTDGYPSCVNFHQDRLWWAGATSTPGRVDASNSGDYENMAPSNQDGTVVDSNALNFTLNAGSVNAIRWMMSDEVGLLIGTAGSEWSIAPSTTQQAITATNVNAKQMTSYGSAIVTPLRVGKATLFVQRTGRKLRELFYQFTYNTFQALDISLVAEHLTQSGIKQFTQQLAPQQITWIVRNDGKLVAMTYDKDQEICGWHQHRLGGFSDSAQTADPLAESVVCIPAPGIQRDEVWLVAKRYINGAVVRYVEVMDKMWEDGDTTANCCFLDCSESYNAAGGTTVTNLDWLKGQTVGVLTDGAVHPDCVVNSAGDITLNWAATTVQVGLKYTSSFRTLPIEAGGADGPSQGKLKRVYLSVVRFFQSVGMSAGSNDFGVTSYPQPFRTSTDPMSGPIGLYDGDKRWAYEGTYLSEGQVYFETSDPLPCNITMVMAKVDTQDYT